MANLFQSTRPIRGATRGPYDPRQQTPISIHAPHTGRDGLSADQFMGSLVISIHAPHTGRDRPPAPDPLPCAPFQSTRPIRGATRR